MSIPRPSNTALITIIHDGAEALGMDENPNEAVVFDDRVKGPPVCKHVQVGWKAGELSVKHELTAQPSQTGVQALRAFTDANELGTLMCFRERRVGDESEWVMIDPTNLSPLLVDEQEVAERFRPII